MNTQYDISSPFLSDWTRLFLKGCPSTLGSIMGSTRVPSGTFPDRPNTDGMDVEIESVELFKSFCSLWFDGAAGEYKLVDIEGFVWNDSFAKSALAVNVESLFDTVIDLDIECIVTERGWTAGTCWVFWFPVVDDDDNESSVLALELFKADLRNFVTVLNNNTVSD